VLSYEALLAHVWSGQDVTREPWGTQYKSAIWTHDAQQREIALRTGDAEALRRHGTLRVPIEPLEHFWRAEDYHQKHSLRRARVVVDELVARFGSDQAMVDSMEAARLNALLGGRRDEEVLDRLLAEVALSPGAERELRAAAR
jgi:peptide-methionine (S)-S-oxide reductase